jgi:hypothetical protein
MPVRLLDRQTRLLEHLTGSEGIFGGPAGASTDPTLDGIDRGLLHLEARFSHEKRMQKIEWVLTRTLELLGAERLQLVRDFVEACPPSSISWLDNARQFHDFLAARWRREAPERPYLPDVASYELAYAAVRADESAATAGSECASETPPPGALRRRPNVVLLRCAYDIRPILEGQDGDAVLGRRETRFAVAMLPGTDDPVVFDLSSDLFELLEILDQFVDPALFEGAPGMDKLITDLVAHGLVEVRQ